MKKDDATYDETPVEISGNDDQIKKAKELIQEIIGPSTSVTSSMAGMTCFKYVLLENLFYMFYKADVCFCCAVSLYVNIPYTS